MQLRRFTGDSMPKALGAVREALGDDAIILSNRQIDGRVEIVATTTLDERALAAAEPFASSSAPAPTTSFARPAAGADVPVTLSAAARAIQQAAGNGPGAAPSARSSELPRVAFTDLSARTGDGRTVTAANEAIGATPGSRDAVDTLSQDLAAMSAAERPLTLGARAESVAGADPVPAATTEGVPPAAAEAETEALLGATPERMAEARERRAEKRAIRVEERLRRLEVNLWGELEPMKAAHLRQLLGLGIGAELAVRLVERIVGDMTAEAAMRQSLTLLKSTLPIGVDETGRKPGVTVLSGPAGGGKTTALVKLALQQVQRAGNQSVVMIAADNRRIGAFETLQVYGRLLGVPVVQAHDADELASLIEAFAHKPLVLVDHVPLERGDALPLPGSAALSATGGEPRTLRHLLILPATLESRAFEALVAGHAGHGITHGVLTQLDRSARLGAYFAPLVRHHLPIAYWTDNARVQTPLEKADASVLVATAMATGARLAPTEDERCLLGLLQPTRRDIGEAPFCGSVSVGAGPEASEREEAR